MSISRYFIIDTRSSFILFTMLTMGVKLTLHHIHKSYIFFFRTVKITSKTCCGRNSLCCSARVLNDGERQNSISHFTPRNFVFLLPQSEMRWKAKRGRDSAPPIQMFGANSGKARNLTLRYAEFCWPRFARTPLRFTMEIVQRSLMHWFDCTS